MSKRFHVDPDERISVYETEPTDPASAASINCIVIRARMNVEIAGRVQDEMRKRNQATGMDGEIGVASVALLLHNILAWSGPDFDDLPCTPENIVALPPATLDPFIEKVVNRLGELNRKRESPNGKLPATGSTSASAGAADSKPSASDASASSDRQPNLSLQLATTTPKLRSHIVSTGRQNKLDD